MTEQAAKPVYRTLPFVLGTFAITWACAVLLAFLDTERWGALMLLPDFLKSAAPLIVALMLLRKHLNPRFLLRFFLGTPRGPLCYALVAALFLAQLLNFYLFRMQAGPQPAVFASVFVGQLVFGGALEEGGWRGYLQPALERRMHALPAALCVGVIWALWHLPYFFLPGSMHTDGNFFVYLITTVITGFILTAIHKLTGSVLLCTLFHGWQNTIVMTIPSDMGSVGFLLFFAALGVVSIVILCVRSKAGRTPEQ